MADLLKLTPAESVEARASSPDALEVEATYGRAGSPPPKHFHPSQDRDVFRLAGPDWLLPPALAALGAIGRVRGYSSAS